MGVFPFLHSQSRRGFSPEISDLAGVLKTVLERLYVGLDNPDFNYAIVTAPTEQIAYRWKAQLDVRTAEAPWSRLKPTYSTLGYFGFSFGT